MKKTYNTVTYLRIIACILIVRGHYFSLFELPEIIGAGCITGAGPVVLFFVISGFLAYMSLEEYDVILYYKKRVLRIIPPYYFTLLLCMIFKVYIVGEMKSWVGWGRYFLFINMLLPTRNFNSWSNLYGFWTMGCFPIMYLVAPFLHKFIKKERKWMWLCAGCFLMSAFLKIVILHILGVGGFDGVDSLATLNPFGMLYLFAMGMTSAYAYKNNIDLKVNSFYGVLLLIMQLLGKSGYILWGIGTAIILTKPTVELRIENNFIWKKVTGFLDGCSFNIYLLHLFVVDVWMYYTNNKSAIGALICVVVSICGAALLSSIERRIFWRKIK